MRGENMSDSRPESQPSPVIRASELAQYGYCARAWWLSAIKGVPTTHTGELARGEAAHRRHGRGVWLGGVLRWAAVALAAAGVALAIIALLK